MLLGQPLILRDCTCESHHLDMSPEKRVARTFSVRDLVVVDLHGAHGTALRRHLVLIECVLGVVLGAALGGYLLHFGGVVGWISGLWSLGIAANYVPPTDYAVALSRPGRLSAAVGQIDDYPGAARYYTVAQWRLLVPFLVLMLALRPSDRAPGS